MPELCLGLIRILALECMVILVRGNSTRPSDIQSKVLRNQSNEAISITSVMRQSNDTVVYTIDLEVIEPLNLNRIRNGSSEASDGVRPSKYSTLDNTLLGSAPDPLKTGFSSPTPASDAENWQKLYGNDYTQRQRWVNLQEVLSISPMMLWDYPYKTLDSLGLTSDGLKKGLTLMGRTKGFIELFTKALDGRNVSLAIVGGSISAGGGLVIDTGHTDGLYFNGVRSWWKLAVQPFTGSVLQMESIAVGGIGTDYFSYCLKNHLHIQPDIIVWEMAGNDFNRYNYYQGQMVLERFIREACALQSQPNLVFVNFFKGNDYAPINRTCPSFQDQGELAILRYYNIAALSWRDMVCQKQDKVQDEEYIRSLFSTDHAHPNLKSHAHAALLIILYLREIFTTAIKMRLAGGKMDSRPYQLPKPLYADSDRSPLCWTLITSNPSEPVKNNLVTRLLSSNDYELRFATHWPLRYDRIVCWRALNGNAVITFEIDIPIISDRAGRTYEIAVTTHSRWQGKAAVWVDSRQPTYLVYEQIRSRSRRTHVDVIARNLQAGAHRVSFRAVTPGVCISALMVY